MAVVYGEPLAAFPAADGTGAALSGEQSLILARLQAIGVLDSHGV